MATLNEIAYNIKNLAYGGSSSLNEESIGIRQIKFWVHYYRAQILRELVKNGKGVPYECYQSVDLGREQDTHYGDNHSGFGADWKDYLDGLSGTSSRTSTVWSSRTVHLSPISADLGIGEDFYGRDFYNHDVREERGDYGVLSYYIPSILNIDGYGIKVALKEAQGVGDHNHEKINIPVVSKNEWENKKFNRFTFKSPAAYLDTDSETRTILTIGMLRSVLRTVADGYGDPIIYITYANVLLNNPTNSPSWVSDDMEYPFPEQFIGELDKRIIQQEFSIIKQTVDDRVDDNRDTTNVQQEVQKQVRQR